jgi:hypothetical protein
MALMAALGLVGSFAVFRPALAEEGMWLVHALDQAPFDTWQKRGLALGAKDLYDPKGADVCDAVVKLGGGTGSFVSPEGLIVTNHHVAFGALQRSSSVKSDYIHDGFLARTRSEEIPALGYDAYVLDDAKDVTKKVLGKLKDSMTPKERHDAIEKVSKELVAGAEKGKDVFAEVSSAYEGQQYFLYTYLRIKDIRIVYAPPLSIGNYGDEVDNWMWPRHTGDFSFMRAYVAPDGKSADYATENVPYHPRKHLAFSVAPMKEGDFTMVIGYPGATRRYRPSHSIDFYVNAYYPAAIQRNADLIAILQEESDKDRASAIKLAATIRSLENSYKNNQGMLEGLVKFNLLQKKLDEERALKDYMASHPDAQKKYGGLFDEIAAQYSDYQGFAMQYAGLTSMSFVCVAGGSARTLYKWSIERDKKDIDRDEGYMDRDEPDVRRRLELADLRFDEDADRRVIAYYIQMLAELPGERPKAVDAICGTLEGESLRQAVAAAVDAMYAGTKVKDKETRMKMFGMSKKELLALGDPLIAFIAELEADRAKLQTRSETFEGALSKLSPQLLELRALQSGAPLYPDANRTMRVSVGQVKGYAPRNAVTYDYATTLAGVVEKHTGKEPFDAPKKLIELFNARDFGGYVDRRTNDVPVCFLSTDDITGGNSGSAILNGDGAIMGLVFDGNYEAISADYQFIPTLQRAIHVDSRYILFIVDKFAGAQELLEELTVQPQLSHR